MDARAAGRHGRYFAGHDGDPQSITEIRAKLGLDQPAATKPYVGDLAKGNLGNTSPRPRW